MLIENNVSILFNYTITGNTTPLTPQLLVPYNKSISGSGNLTINIPSDYNISDVVNLSILIEKYNEPVQIVVVPETSSSSGSSPCYKDWICSEWSECNNSLEERVCNPIYISCNRVRIAKPITSKYCEIQNSTYLDDFYPINKTIINEEISDIDNKNIYYVIIIIIVLIITRIIFAIRKLIIWRKEDEDI